MSSRKLIVANTFSMAKLYAHTMGFSANNWTYASSVDQMRGLGKDTIVFICGDRDDHRWAIVEAYLRNFHTYFVNDR